MKEFQARLREGRGGYEEDNEEDNEKQHSRQNFRYSPSFFLVSSQHYRMSPQKASKGIISGFS